MSDDNVKNAGESPSNSGEPAREKDETESRQRRVDFVERGYDRLLQVHEAVGSALRAGRDEMKKQAFEDEDATLLSLMVAIARSRTKLLEELIEIAKDARRRNQ